MSVKKFISETFSWDSIAKILFWAIAEILDMFIRGEELSIKDKKAVQLVYCIGVIFGKTWVKETDTELDDEGLANILAKCEDTAEEGDFELPIIPEIE